MKKIFSNTDSIAKKVFSTYLEFWRLGEVTGGRDGGGPIFLEGNGGVSVAVLLATDEATATDPPLANELFELVSLIPKVILRTCSWSNPEAEAASEFEAAAFIGSSSSSSEPAKKY